MHVPFAENSQVSIFDRGLISVFLFVFMNNFMNNQIHFIQEYKGSIV